MMRRSVCSAVIALVLGVALSANVAQARDQIRIVGSSTLYPLTAKVAEHYGKTTDKPSPVVESTGSGGGFKLFCGGIGDEFPDIVDASRPMTGSERAVCVANSVRNISEIRIGYDGIVLIGSKEAPAMKLSPRQLYLALARTVPVQGASVPNPYQKWSDIDPSLPELAIRVYGPPPTSGTRDLLGQLLMERGCKTFADINAMETGEPDSFRLLCRTMRTDGAYIEAGENDRLLISKLEKDPTSYAVMGFNNLERNMVSMQGIPIGGIAPSYETILDGSYSGSRPLFLYVKDDHRQLVPDLAPFIASYVSDAIIGDEGLLVDNGLVPLHESERSDALAQAQKFIKN
ncbi:substrate-binding domain-containing protein [uncultured Thalassospira sp.]|jgi:phosphate transport system substrate-binding protein|uniref:substrate-binding domain-containing protein n=1 Tax=uncultured Thalassospira sp. TaxID=404382 RepID=UPI0030DC07A2|tara:strand:+ start:3413 stop:4447 length:1035 start_codon:yes stop_codon:yes gene_type:complete